MGTSVTSRQLFDKSRADDPIRKLYFTLAWTVTSRRIRIRDLFCRIANLCDGHAIAEVADHIIPARKWVAMHDGDLESFYDEFNLQGACKQCHNAKTRLEALGS